MQRTIIAYKYEYFKSATLKVFDAESRAFMFVGKSIEIVSFTRMSPLNTHNKNHNFKLGDRGAL